MQNSYDENKPLYGSRGIEIYLTLIRQKYSDLNIDELLRYAEMETYQVKDEGHFFSQRQINRFYEKLVELSGNKKIAREAGRFSASPESFSAVQRSLLGLISPVKFYELMGKYVNNITKSAKYEARVLASNKVEIVVTLNPGIKEEPFQCENRMGYWEATATMFKLKPPKIEHPECLFKEGKVCRYIVTWPKSPVTILTIIRNIGLVLLGLSCFVFPGLYYYLHPTQSSLMIFSTLYALAATLLLTTNWFLNKFEKKNLMETIDLLRNSSDQLIEQVDINYENSLLTFWPNIQKFKDCLQKLSRSFINVLIMTVSLSCSPIRKKTDSISRPATVIIKIRIGSCINSLSTLTIPTPRGFFMSAFATRNQS
jgi:hypothetical protein